MADMPQRIAQGVQSLSTLSEDSFNQLISALEEMGPKLFPDQISNELRSKVNIPFDDVSAIVSTIMSLNSHRAHDDGTSEDLADFVVEIATDAKVSTGDRDKFKKRLLRFFELET